MNWLRRTDRTKRSREARCQRVCFNKTCGRLVSDQALFELSSCSSHVRRSPRTRPVFPSLETVKHCRRSFRQRASKGWFSSVILVAPSHANPSSSTLLNHASSSMAASDAFDSRRPVTRKPLVVDLALRRPRVPSRMRRHFDYHASRVHAAIRSGGRYGVAHRTVYYKLRSM